MSDLDTRLAETLDRVAATTKVQSRFDEIATPRRRLGLPRLAVPVMAFAAVVVLFVVPMFLADSSRRNVGGSGSPSPADSQVTVDPSWLTVEPHEVALYNGQSLPGEGGRAPLRSEMIWCFYDDARPVEAHVAGVAVDQPMSWDALTKTCATETDVAAETEATQQMMTVCRGVLDPSEYEEWAAAAEMTVIAGDPEAAKPGFPVVLGWESDCVSESLESNPEVVLTADLSLEMINKIRELELAVVAASIEHCLSYDESEALVSAVVAELEPSYVHTSLAGGREMGDGCFRPFIDQQWGWVFSDIVSVSSSAEMASTIPPISP